MDEDATASPRPDFSLHAKLSPGRVAAHVTAPDALDPPDPVPRIESAPTPPARSRKLGMYLHGSSLFVSGRRSGPRWRWRGRRRRIGPARQVVEQRMLADELYCQKCGRPSLLGCRSGIGGERDELSHLGHLGAHAVLHLSGTWPLCTCTCPDPPLGRSGQVQCVRAPDTCLHVWTSLIPGSLRVGPARPHRGSRRSSGDQPSVRRLPAGLRCAPPPRASRAPG